MMNKEPCARWTSKEHTDHRLEEAIADTNYDKEARDMSNSMMVTALTMGTKKQTGPDRDPVLDVLREGVMPRRLYRKLGPEWTKWKHKLDAQEKLNPEALHWRWTMDIKGKKKLSPEEGAADLHARATEGAAEAAMIGRRTRTTEAAEAAKGRRARTTTAAEAAKGGRSRTATAAEAAKNCHTRATAVAGATPGGHGHAASGDATVDEDIARGAAYEEGAAGTADEAARRALTHVLFPSTWHQHLLLLFI
jgi:hypothetical protein